MPWSVFSSLSFLTAVHVQEFPGTLIMGICTILNNFHSEGSVHGSCQSSKQIKISHLLKINYKKKFLGINERFAMCSVSTPLISNLCSTLMQQTATASMQE